MQGKLSKNNILGIFEKSFDQNQIVRLFKSIFIDNEVKINKNNNLYVYFDNYIKNFDKIGDFYDFNGEKVEIYVVYLKNKDFAEQENIIIQKFIKTHLNFIKFSIVFVVFPNFENWKISLLKEKTYKVNSKEYTKFKRISFLAGKNTNIDLLKTGFSKLLTKQRISIFDLQEVFEVKHPNQQILSEYEQKIFNLNQNIKLQDQKFDIGEFGKFIIKKFYLNFFNTDLKEFFNKNKIFLNFFNKNHVFYENLYQKFFQDLENKYPFILDEREKSDFIIALTPQFYEKIYENFYFGVLDSKVKIKKSKFTGTYYTPDFIVEYMCKQSLKYYLKTNLHNVSDTDLQILFDVEDENFQFEVFEQSKKTQKILEDVDFYLTHIKICDPSVGSGAFAMGMLKEVVKLRIICAFYLQKKIHPYEIKRNFIENSFFGADMDEFAIEITKLRILLSLFNHKISIEKNRTKIHMNFSVGDSLFDDIFKNQQFDVVIGNPPYKFLSGKNSPVKLLEKQGKKEESIKLKQKIQQITRKYPNSSYKVKDLYKWFIELGYNLTISNGILSFITPNTFINLQSFQDVREIIFTKMHNLLLVDLGFNVFDEPIVPFAIFISEKIEKIEKNNVNYCDLKEFEIKNNDIDFIIKKTQQTVNYNDKRLLIYKNNLAKKIYENTKFTLKNYLKISEGEHSLKNDFSFGSKTSFPNSIPVIYDKKLTSFSFVEVMHLPLQLCTKCNYEKHRGKRFFIRKTGDKIIAVLPYNFDFAVAHQNLYIVKPLVSIDLKVFVAFLSSKLFTFLYQNGIYGQKNRILAQFRIYALNELPFPDLKQVNTMQFVDIINKLYISQDVELKEKYENMLNEMIFNIYNLTSTEIKTILSFF